MWYKAESATRPTAVETIGAFTYVRKNIVEEHRTHEEKTMKMYVYDERCFTADEYANFVQEQKNRANIDYIAMMTDVELED